LYLKENGNPGIDGYTPEQRFFISWSTIWRSKCVMKPWKPSTDPHSPGMYRAYVPLQNIDTFIKLLISKKMMDVHCTRKRVRICNIFFINENPFVKANGFSLGFQCRFFFLFATNN
jgi:predicted metalloendopeptidase